MFSKQVILNFWKWAKYTFVIQSDTFIGEINKRKIKSLNEKLNFCKNSRALYSLK